MSNSKIKNVKSEYKLITLPSELIPNFSENLTNNPWCHRRFVSSIDSAEFFVTAREGNILRTLYIAPDKSGYVELFVTEDALEDRFKAYEDMEFSPVLFFEIKETLNLN